MQVLFPQMVYTLFSVLHLTYGLMFFAFIKEFMI